MGERYPYKVDVVGSIPTSCTIMSGYSSGLRGAVATRISVSSNLTLLSICEIQISPPYWASRDSRNIPLLV